MEHFGHGGSADVGALRSHTRCVEIAAGMLTVADVDVGDDVDNAAVGFLGETFVEATVSGLHVEDGDVQAFGTNHAQAGVGVAEHKHSVGLCFDHQLIRSSNDVAHGFAEVFANSIHIYFGISKFEVLEEHTVKVVVVVLACMGENHVKVFAATVDDCRKSYDFGTGADNDQQLETSVIFKFSHLLFQRMCRDDWG